MFSISKHILFRGCQHLIGWNKNELQQPYNRSDRS